MKSMAPRLSARPPPATTRDSAPFAVHLHQPHSFQMIAVEKRVQGGTLHDLFSRADLPVPEHAGRASIRRWPHEEFGCSSPVRKGRAVGDRHCCAVQFGNACEGPTAAAFAARCCALLHWARGSRRLRSNSPRLRRRPRTHRRAGAADRATWSCEVRIFGRAAGRYRRLRRGRPNVVWPVRVRTGCRWIRRQVLRVAAN